MKRLRPSQQIALLAACAVDPDMAFILVHDEDAPWLRLDEGPPRQLLALLGFYVGHITFHGLAAILGRGAPAFWQALDMLRHPLVGEPYPTLLRGRLDRAAVTKLAMAVVCAPEPVWDEGFDLGVRLLAAPRAAAEVLEARLGDEHATTVTEAAA